ncbi:Amino Acid-Polyamine-Organocation (APC) Family [Achlya hypogyna]|uniref:Amino Acid-Polyamine-Organocation (APC) Family n=1 Tax=Achlya hypogyna TaxID=1202772 RepID=A0A1V9YTK2_ACHHY|nr:Amino Acid-Polyamine-Organocation (APC) Family [Achlya hypogyna]
MSALPFAGGAYGLGRCTIGFTVGFLVACCEILEYIAHTSTAMLSLTSLLTHYNPALAIYAPILWFVLFILIIGIHIYGSTLFWRVNLAICILSLGLTIIWAGGSIPYLNFNDTLTADTLVIGGASGCMQAIPSATWLFVGLEALSTAGDDVADPRVTVPTGQRRAIYTLFITGFVSLIFVAGLPPGVDYLPNVGVTTSTGFMAMFGISDEHATLLAIPTSFGTTYGFVFAYTKLLTAVASSNLISPYFQMRFFQNQTPAISLVTGAVLAYLLCSMCFPATTNVPYNVCMLSATVAYSTQCYGYIYLKRNFGHLERKYTSPLGVPGAVFSMVVWLVIIVSIAFFQDDNGAAVVTFVALEVVLVLYYHYYAKHSQIFSEEERKILFVTHVAKFNNKKKSKHTSKSTLRTQNSGRRSGGTSSSHISDRLKSIVKAQGKYEVKQSRVAAVEE